MSEDTVLLDFEFNRAVEKNVNLVCCTTQEYRSGITKDWWLHNNPKKQKELKNYLSGFKNVIAYAAIAEARSYLSLGLDPLKFNWIDLFLEYRCLTNHNDILQWGEQYQDGRVKKVYKPKPKWQQTEDDKAMGFVATHSLSEAAFKLLGKKIDTVHKKTMRDLIISNPDKFTPKEQQHIMAYCQSDVVYLKAMWKKCIYHYKQLDRDLDNSEIKDNAIIKGRYSAHTALMESRGYPIDNKKVKNFSNQVGNILFDLQREINSLFPEIQPFVWNKKENRYSEKQSNIKDWIEENADVKRWTKTKTGALSLALDAWTKLYTYAHDYPEDSFPAQMIRYGKLKQSIYGFNASPGGKRKNFWDSVGSDGRVRPYMNIFKAQSSRSQPAASGFMFLKPAWMRALVVPEKGKFMAGIDYGSEEFFVSALEASDEPMIQSYLSGDPYFSFAKLSGQVPQDAIRKDYEDIRNLNKATILGISYLMSKIGLAAKLTADTDRVWSEDDAQAQIDLFYDTFWGLQEYQEEVQQDYKENGYLKLDCVGKGSKVVTDSGLKNIENIVKGDLIWDGMNYVSHGGLVQKGERVVIHLEKIGIELTPDHLIWADGMWKAAIELEGKETPHLASVRYSPRGKLLEGRSSWETTGLSYVAAYVALKDRLELEDSFTERLSLALAALNLSEVENLSPRDAATYLLTSIFDANGKLATTMRKKGASIKIQSSTRGTVLEASFLNLNPLENSFLTLLNWMGIPLGIVPSIELITTGAMSPETYELSVKKLTTRTEVYDIKDCGPQRRFQAGKALVHNCGWYMWGDNENFRSVTNCRIQGQGAAIMRRAVDLAQDAGIDILFTLHDALYMEANIGEEWKIIELRECMREAFAFFYPDFMEEANQIRLDPFAWSPDYKADSKLIVEENEIPCSNLYIDKRALTDYKKFSQYFEDRAEDEL